MGTAALSPLHFAQHTFHDPCYLTTTQRLNQAIVKECLASIMSFQVPFSAESWSLTTNNPLNTDLCPRSATDSASMLRKISGPVGGIIIEVDPPYRPWSDNQATYLFFPVFFCFILSLTSNLSAPVIRLGSVKLAFQGNGTMVIGTWGWCADTVINATCTSSAAGCANALNETCVTALSA